MLNETRDEVLPPVLYMIHVGGMPLLASGVAFSIWGAVNLLRRCHAGVIFLQSVMSLIPGVVAMVGIYAACLEFTAMGAAETPPKPAEFARVIGQALSLGFFGIASTILPVALGLCGFLKHCRTTACKSEVGPE